MANEFKIVKLGLIVAIVITIVVLVVQFALQFDDYRSSNRTQFIIRFVGLLIVGIIGLYGAHKESFWFTLIFAITTTILFAWGFWDHVSPAVYYIIAQIVACVLAYIFAFMLRNQA